MMILPAPPPQRRMTSYRHREGTCGRLLFRAYLPPGARVEIMCPKCGLMVVVTGEPEAQPAAVVFVGVSVESK